MYRNLIDDDTSLTKSSLSSSVTLCATVSANNSMINENTEDSRSGSKKFND